MIFYKFEDIFNEVEKRLKKYCDELGLEPDCFEGRLQVVAEPKNQRHMSVSEVLSVMKEIYKWNRSSHFAFHIRDAIEDRSIFKIYYRIRKDEWGWAIK